jgi:SAM-dependent methyltransferase
LDVNSSGCVQTWNSADAADSFHRGKARRMSVLAAATYRLMELARLRPGAHVLDVAAGTGDTALEAAHRVGPRGYVLATDLSASMLQVAGNEAVRAGLTWVETRVVDAERLSVEPSSFDAAISRNGLMFVPHVDVALARIYQALRSGGRIALLVWAGPDRNPYIEIPQRIVSERTGIAFPAPGEPGVFGLARPGALFEALERAGFRDPDVAPVPSNRVFSSARETVEGMKSAKNLLNDALRQVSRQRQAEVWAEVERAFGAFATPQGIELPGEVLVAGATK